MADPGPSTTQPVQEPIQVDPEWEDRDDSDSAYGDQLSNFSASLTSSVCDYQFENGRRYHAYDAGSYVMPNDEQESDRMDIFHEMMMNVHDGKLHLAPIGNNPQRILDIGTGTGIWAIDMGDKYPSAEIIGNDLSPIQPQIVPPNVRFMVDNVEKPWVYTAPFDYIHCRYLAAAISDWPRLMEQIYDNVKPGCWVEFSDYDIDFYCFDGSLAGTHLEKWIKDILRSCDTMGRDPCPGKSLMERAKAAGFVDLTERVYELPTGGWAKDKRLKNLGLWSAIHLLQGLEGFTLALFTRILKWTNEEIQVLLSLVRKDINNPNIHTYQRYYVVYGRRPENPVTAPQGSEPVTLDVSSSQR